LFSQKNLEITTKRLGSEAAGTPYIAVWGQHLKTLNPVQHLV